MGWAWTGGMSMNWCSEHGLVEWNLHEQVEWAWTDGVSVDWWSEWWIDGLSIDWWSEDGPVECTWTRSLQDYTIGTLQAFSRATSICLPASFKIYQNVIFSDTPKNSMFPRSIVTGLVDSLTSRLLVHADVKTRKCLTGLLWPTVPFTIVVTGVQPCRPCDQPALDYLHVEFPWHEKNVRKE